MALRASIANRRTSIGLVIAVSLLAFVARVSAQRSASLGTPESVARVSSKLDVGRNTRSSAGDVTIGGSRMSSGYAANAMRPRDVRAPATHLQLGEGAGGGIVHIAGF